MNHVFLVGRPNVGKTYIFNKLSGENQKVANFSGATTRRKDSTLDAHTKLIDLPGIYSLTPQTEDEKVSVKALTQSAPDDLVCIVIEALKLQSGLPLALQVIEFATQNLKPVVLILNMVDEAQKHAVEIDSEVFSKKLGVPVFLTSAKTGTGIDKVKEFIKNRQWSTPQTSWAAPKDQMIDELIREGVKGDILKGLDFQKRVDRFFLSPFLGSLFFLFLTFLIFQSIFTWATPLMDLVELSLNQLGLWASNYITTPTLKSFTENAIFAGFGSFLVFTPQIFVLTAIVGFLEKSGYMARATIICHKFLSFFGLNGKSFIPYMTGHACAIPAIYAARSIENPWIRNLTILTVPLTACSARIPVYALLIRVLVPDQTIFLGLLGLQGLAFFSLYFFGIFMALTVSGLIDAFARFKQKTSTKSNRFFIMELPPYRMPRFDEVIIKGLQTTWSFIRNAGPIIFMVNAAIWVLSYFPAGENGFDQSYMVQIGKAIEPVFAPLGLNWIHGVAILMSFLAREVFVSTLGLLYGFQSDDLDQLVEQLPMQDLSTEAGIALLVFFAIALQCASTVGALSKETLKKSWPYMALVGYLILAYGVAFIIYQGLSVINRYI